MVIKQPCMAGVADFQSAPGIGLACHLEPYIYASLYSDLTMKVDKRKQGKCFQQKAKAKSQKLKAKSQKPKSKSRSHYSPHHTIHIKTQQVFRVNHEQETVATHSPPNFTSWDTLYNHSYLGVGIKTAKSENWIEPWQKKG